MIMLWVFIAIPCVFILICLYEGYGRLLNDYEYNKIIDYAEDYHEVRSYLSNVLDMEKLRYYHYLRIKKMIDNRNKRLRLKEQARYLTNILYEEK